PPRGGRRRENLSRDEEAAFLEPFFEQAQGGGVLVVNTIKQALEQRVGRKVALSSVYNLLHRHGWRKLAPDKRHPKIDVVAQEQWKKTPRETCTNARAIPRKRAGEADVSRRGSLWPDLRCAAVLVPQAAPSDGQGPGTTTRRHCSSRQRLRILR
ncbi:MAG: helix-turn-helix domain-containing protein, partial [Gammaproteobacteria bacterium]